MNIYKEETLEHTGQVVEVSRRHVSVLADRGEILTGTLSSRALQLAIGDRVTFEQRADSIFVTKVHDAARRLFRSYRGDVRCMGSNIDHLLVITAVGETLNPLVIDRMIIAARMEAIPLSLIVNKKDKGIEHVSFITSVYAHLGIEVIPTNAKNGEGLDYITGILNQPKVRTTALCGVSGVGKSTILNKLIPGAKVKTAEVSAKTGQGRQTTTQPKGFLFAAEGASPKVVIDFPGVGFFGLSHVDPVALMDAFDEMVRVKGQCRFLDCKHLQEPGCIVREMVESGAMAPWRYQSYLQILEEVDDAREY